MAEQKDVQPLPHEMQAVCAARAETRRGNDTGCALVDAELAVARHRADSYRRAFGGPPSSDGILPVDHFLNKKDPNKSLHKSQPPALSAD